MRDTGSAGPGTIDCEAHTVTSTGEQTFRVTTQTVGGSAHVVVWRGGQALF
jgi:hypothetical protein